MEDSGLCHLAEQLLGVFFQAQHLGNTSSCRQGFLPHRYLLMVDTLSRVFFCAAPVELTPTADGSSCPWPRSVPFLLLTARSAGSWAWCALCCGTERFGGSAQRAAGARRARTAGFCRCSLPMLWQSPLEDGANAAPFGPISPGLAGAGIALIPRDLSPSILLDSPHSFVRSGRGSAASAVGS